MRIQSAITAIINNKLHKNAKNTATEALDTVDAQAQAIVCDCIVRRN